MRVVLAGFGPFPGAPFNPSALLVEALARRRRPALAGIELTTHIFATAYEAVDRDLPKLFATKPDIVLIFGFAGRRSELCIETRARNAVSVLFPDASGFRPKSGLIARTARQSRRGNAPFARLLGAARSVGIPARLSRDAGRYLCNYVYWRALEKTRYGGPLDSVRPYSLGKAQSATTVQPTAFPFAAAAGGRRRGAVDRARRRKPPPPDSNRVR